MTTLGADIEYFLQHQSGKFVSAIPYVDGTKEKPKALRCGGNIQRDNVALEFATSIVRGKEEFISHMRDIYNEVNEYIPEEHFLNGDASAVFETDQLDHPEAERFGCDVDYDAWNKRANDTPKPKVPGFRSCGGHIHIGHEEGDGNEFLLTMPGKCQMIKMMDVFAGIISTVLDNSKASLERKSLYGKAGCHRPKPYGVEYRTLSNYWTKSPSLVMLMYSITEDALMSIREDKEDEIINAIGGEERVQRIINEGMYDEARSVIDNILVNYMSKESKHYLAEAERNLETYNDIKKVWGL